MAKQRFGINDGYRGTVGTVIGYQWRGQWCLRARPRFVHNPRTERQQQNRQLFKAVWSFATQLLMPLRTSLRQTALESHMTECNRFMHINKGCFALDGEGRLTVDYEYLAVSEGPVAPIGFLESVVEGKAITIPFEKNPLHLRANGDDEVYVLALCPDLEDNRLRERLYEEVMSCISHVLRQVPEEQEPPERFDVLLGESRLAVLLLDALDSDQRVYDLRHLVLGNCLVPLHRRSFLST